MGTSVFPFPSYIHSRLLTSDDEMYSTDPVWVDENLELVSIWKDAVEAVVEHKPGIVCSPGTDDQRFFVRGGIAQTIVYGPGNIKYVVPTWFLH